MRKLGKVGVAVVGGVLALVIQLFFWGWIARNTISVDLPKELEIESAGRYYAPVERRYYELIFAPSVSVTVPLTKPLRQIGVLDSDTISPCLSHAPLSDAVAQTYACPLGATKSTIVAKGPRGSRRSAYIWSLQEHWPVTDTGVLSRAVHLTLESRSAQVTYTTWLSLESVALNSLCSGDIPPGLFVKLVFYPDRPKFTGAEFYSISKALTTISETRALVTIHGTLSGSKHSSKNVSDVLGLSLPLTDTRHLSPTLFVVQTKDVAITEFDPFPSAKTDRLLTWRNPAAAPHIVYQEGSRSPIVADSVVRLREKIGELRDRAGMVVSLPVILMVPIIPVIWLFRLARRGGYPEGFGWDCAKVALELSGLIWLVSIVSMVLAPMAYTEVGVNAYAPLADLALWASSLAAAVLVLPVYWRLAVTQRTGKGKAVWRLGLACIVGLYGLIAVLALRSNDLFRWDALLALMGVILLLTAAALAWLPCQTQTSWREIVKSVKPGVWVLVVGAALVLAYPSWAARALAYPLDGWPVAVWREFWFPFCVYLLPYVPLVILLTQMHAHREEREPAGDQLARGVGHFLFAFYLIGATRGLEMGASASPQDLKVIPVAFVLACFVAYRWLISDQYRPGSTIALTNMVYAHRGQLIKYVLDVEWAQKARDKLFDDSADADDYEKARTQFDRYLTEHRPRCLDSGQAPEKVIFACGPRSTDWENAMLAVRRGLVLMVPLFVIYSPPLLAQAIRSVETAYLPLQLITRYLAPIFVKWIFYSFFLGYFFRYIRGCNGWQKGLSLAVAILFCTLVHDVLVRASTRQDLLALALDAAQTVLFLTILGIWAFDYQTLRDHGYGWRRLLIVHNVAFLGSYVSSVLATLGTVIAAAATDQLAEVVTALLNLAIPGIKL